MNQLSLPGLEPGPPVAPAGSVARTDAPAHPDVPHLDDPYLDEPLDGVRLVEASAGTGKTYTLATLVTRLVIERGLRVGQVLAVTFTEAATQELRERLRLRLALAARVAAQDPALDGDAAEVRTTRALVARRLAQEDAGVLARRLQRAAHEIDLAAVFTIHGFCARALAEHALETGQAFVAPALAGSDQDLRDEVAADVWRMFGSDPLDAGLLQSQWPAGPGAMAKDLGPLLRAPRLLPEQRDPGPDPSPALQAAAARVREAWSREGDTARAQLERCLDAGVFDGRKARRPSYDRAWQELADGLTAGEWPRGDGRHIDKLTPARLRECVRAGREGELPGAGLFDTLAEWFALDDARDAWLQAQGIALLHRVRGAAAARMARLKRVRRLQTFDDLIDDVAAALDGPHGDVLAARLRSQYAVALVDEFQDTDARQWAIFDRVFGLGSGSPALFLVGDPKQAIYRFRGGDVHTYLRARERAEPAPPLDRNFRSRPSVLRAIAALYAAGGDTAFVVPEIGFREVTPGDRVADADYLHGGAPAHALTLRALPPPAAGGQWKADPSRELATAACVQAIHAVLRDAGAATLDGAPVRAGDIAVLVRRHGEAGRIRAALAAAGIPAVTASPQSLFASGEAEELLAVFEALLQPGDGTRLRAALATVLVGLDAAAIDALERDGEALRAWQLRTMDWRERWQRHGPLALVSDLAAAGAPRLLGLLDGERRLTNLLQLGEELQQGAARALGEQGLVDWLRHRIAEADPDDEAQQLRLESDAACVRILTLHKSKGLEFPLVFLPFVGIGGANDEPDWVVVDDADGRALHVAPDGTAVAAHRREDEAEEARLLYVGLTRARHALWIATGPLYRTERTALARLLRDAEALRAGSEGAIVVDGGALPDTDLPPLPRARGEAVPPPRPVERALTRDWWIYSFTQLANEDAGEALAADAAPDERGAQDEREPVSAADARFAGSRFGNALHAALERVDFAAWRRWDGGAPPPGEDAALRTALQDEGYGDDVLADGTALLAGLVGQTLATELPEGVRLCDVPPAARRAEMEFHFALRPVDVDTLLRTLHAHGVLRERHAFGVRRRLEGLMTGKIDLVYAHDGRYYVLDYKSNRLPAYDADALARAMADSEYTLQALLYTVALHRWLRFRLGTGYDYARHIGGVRYLFCRGLDAFAGAPATGVHAWRPAPELVAALDALFAGDGAPVEGHA